MLANKTTALRGWVQVVSRLPNPTDSSLRRSLAARERDRRQAVPVALVLPPGGCCGTFRLAGQLVGALSPSLSRRLRRGVSGVWCCVGYRSCSIVVDCWGFRKCDEIGTLSSSQVRSAMFFVNLMLSFTLTGVGRDGYKEISEQTVGYAGGRDCRGTRRTVLWLPSVAGKGFERCFGNLVRPSTSACHLRSWWVSVEDTAAMVTSLVSFLGFLPQWITEYCFFFPRGWSVVFWKFYFYSAVHSRLIVLPLNPFGTEKWCCPNPLVESAAVSKKNYGDWRKIPQIHLHYRESLRTWDTVAMIQNISDNGDRESRNSGRKDSGELN